MKFLADECCDSGLVEFLRNADHQVDHIQELLQGVTDKEVLRKAKKERRILLTEDKVFGELVFRLKKAGLWYNTPPVSSHRKRKKVHEITPADKPIFV